MPRGAVPCWAMRAAALHHIAQPALAALALTTVLHCGACQTHHTANVPTLQREPAPPSKSDARTTARSDGSALAERPVAMLDNEAVTISTMQHRLFERAGAEILRELQLEAALRQALLEQEVAIDEDALQEEETLLLSRLSVNEDDARALLSEVRNSEGLGPARYEALLWRNAALRALVQPDLQLNDPLLRRLHRMRHGQRLQIRLIVVPTLQEAEELHARLTAGEAFDAIASTRSIDSSRDRGGLVDPISLEDPAWPAALLSELESMQAGELTDIVFLEDRFAIAQVDALIAADDIDFESTRDEMLALARLTQERLKMAELAGRLGVKPSLQVLDPTLRQAWKVDEGRRQDSP